MKLEPVHPGDVLAEDFMRPLGLTAYRVAQAMGIPQIRLSLILRGRRAVTPDAAIRLSKVFGTSADVWVRMQARYDLERADAAALVSAS